MFLSGKTQGVRVTSTTECRTLDRTLRRKGAYVFAVVGFVWATAGSSIVGRAAWVVLVVAAAVSVTVAVLGHRSGKNGAGERRRALPEGWGRSVGVVNIVQIVRSPSWTTECHGHGLRATTTSRRID